MPFTGVGKEDPGLVSLAGGPGACLFDIAAIAASTKCAVGGSIPQARHGGIGVREARAGSKLEGTGFEKEQITHTQVALCEGADAGLLYRGGVEPVGLCGVGMEGPRDSCFSGLG
jgi:hypothetical protein